MITIILLIIAISFDAMSYGLAQGLKNIKVPFFYVMVMTLISTMLFTLPLYLSKYIAKYISEVLLNIINGSILIILGIFYLISYFKTIKQEVYTKNSDKQILSLKSAIASTFPISLDAIFTAIFTGYTLQFVLFGIIFYIFMTFSSIYVLNLIGLKISKSSTINLGFLSAFIFFIIGILKLFGI